MSDNALTVQTELAPLSRDIIKRMAMEIGKEVASHIETMYPNAVAATSKNMLLSVRNTVFNEIMAAIELNDEAAITARLDCKAAWRRKHRALWRKYRAGDAVPADIGLNGEGE